MQTDAWGPHAWEFIHHTAFGAPKILDSEDKTKYKELFSNLRCTLPCILCRTAFSELFNYITIHDYLDSRNGLCYWTFVIHNLVNRKLGKKLESFNNVVHKYENLRARCGKKDDKEKYEKCKATLTEFTREESNIIAKEIRKKYKEIASKQIENYYYSDKILDPKFHKCPLNYNKT